MILLIWSFVFLVAVAVYLHQVYTTFSRHGVKNSRVIPILGHTGGYLFGREHFAERALRTYNKFPEERFIGRFQLMKPSLMVRDIELVKKITVKDFEHFLDRRSFINEDIDPFFGRNLFSLRGKDWKEMRSTLSPAFTSSKMKLMVPFMVEVGEQMIKTLKTKIEASGVNYIDIDGKELTTRFANDVIATCAFGLKVDSLLEEHNQFYAMGKTATTFNYEQIFKFLGFASFPALMKSLNIAFFTNEFKDFFKNLIMNTMQEREEHRIVRPDMVHLLMEVKKGKLSHDDVSTKDVDAGFATVEESAVDKKKINREVLRLWPPAAALDRICVKDYNMGKPNDKAKKDFILRKGFDLTIPVWAFHRDPQFFPNPLKFDPERFSDENKRNIQAFTYMPFGSGPRNCIGSRFALSEIKIMTYQLLLQMEVSRCEKTRITTKLSKDSLNVTIEGGHWIRLKAR